MDRTQIILQPDGSVFHLRLKKGDIAPLVLLVGDPGRVEQVKRFFDSLRLEKHNREFYAATGSYRGNPLTVLSTGIGTDNIDIVLNELDLLVNYNEQKGCFSEEKQSLRLVRLGTSGSIQEDLPPGTFLLSSHAVGTEGLLYFYQQGEKEEFEDFREHFVSSVNWPASLARPYLVKSDPLLLSALDSMHVSKGITLSANGFYGPQGRSLRLKLSHPDMVPQLAAFRYREMRLTNFEMETSALFGLSSLLGHQAASICAIIANRKTGEFLTDYKPTVDRLIEYTLDRLTTSP